jgi:transposase-like protein
MMEILTGAYDFLLRDVRIKPTKTAPAVLHQKTCPICESKRVNVYYSNQIEKHICKKCMDKLLNEKGGAE